MKKIFSSLLILGAALVSCKKEAALNVNLAETNPNTQVPGLTDAWLTDNFLNLYNMEVVYKFNRFEAGIDRDLVPVKEDQIQPVMEAVRDVWILPYLTVAGRSFLMPVLPKQIALVGSPNYNIDGSITLGTADAGRKVNLFTVNDYNKTNVPNVERMLHTIHHEFVHILHQNIPVPPDFEKIAPEYVGGSWISFTNSDVIAKNLGFITRYSRMNKDEDFAETSSFLLVEGQDAYNVYANTSSLAASEKLRKKEQMVVDYFKGSHGLDFRALQTQVKEAKERLTGSRTSFRRNFAAGAYKAFTIDKEAANQSAAFLVAYNATIANVMARNDITIDNKFDLEFVNLNLDRSNIVLKISGRRLSPAFSGAFWFNLQATINVNTGRIRFVAGPQGTGQEYTNGRDLQVAFKPLLDYLINGNFNADWIEHVIPGSRDVLAGFNTLPGNQLGFYGSIKR